MRKIKVRKQHKPRNLAIVTMRNRGQQVISDAKKKQSKELCRKDFD